MKKIKLIGGVCLALVLVVALLGFAPALAGDETDFDRHCYSCVIGKNGTADGSLIALHTEELRPNTAERLVVVPRETHEPGEMKNVGWEMIPEVPVTYKVIVNKYWPEGSPPGDWAAGINEFGVSLTANVHFSKEEPLPPNTGVSYCYLVQATLERARTAQEAVEVMGWLVDEYGVGGKFAECCYVLADQDEAWYLELTYRHWAARKVGDDELFPITARYLIGTDFDLASADVVDYAVAQGWYDPLSGEPFSFKDAYADPDRQNTGWFIQREARIVELLAPKWGSITVRDCFELMRDHYEGTPLYEYPPHEVPWGSDDMPMCTNHSCMAFLFQMRSDVPTEIGALMWYRMSAACSSVHMPVYTGITEVPEVYSMLLTDEYDPVSAWWHFKTLMDNVDEDYADLNPHVRDAWYKFEEREFKQVPGVEKRALKAYQSGNIDKMNKILTGYTNKMLMKAYNKANALNNWVLAQ